jgi:tetratricopeptide (TPR) repeat protein
MTDQEIPRWEDDPLSEFFANAEYNDRATSLNYPNVYAVLQRTHEAFTAFEKILENDGDPARLIPRFLIVRAHASFLAATRLAMSGELPEAYAVLRLALEQTWYALHIAKDPAPTRRAEIWLSRNTDDAAKTACKQEFTVRNVRTTHEQLDPDTAGQLQALYEAMIDFGAHPNQLGTLAAALKGHEDAAQITYGIGILHPVKIPQMATIRLAIAVAVGTLKVAQLIYPERLQNTESNAAVATLVADLNTVFKQ